MSTVAASPMAQQVEKLLKVALDNEIGRAHV